MTSQEYILDLVEWEPTNGHKTVELIKECFNCQKVEILEDGVIIADPQAEHLLSDEELAKFVAWHQAR